MVGRGDNLELSSTNTLGYIDLSDYIINNNSSQVDIGDYFHIIEKGMVNHHSEKSIDNISTMLEHKEFNGDLVESDYQSWRTDNKRSLDLMQKGIALKSPTHVYKSVSRSSSVWKSYNQSSILYYKEFTKDWYEATVIINGKREVGYINKNDLIETNVKK